MQPFYKTVLRTSLNIFVRNVFIKRNLPEIQGKYFSSRFSHGKESVFSKKCG